MDKKPKRVTISNMRLRGKVATILCLLALICEASAVRLGSTAKAYKGLATLASTAVEEKELKIDTTLREIDEFLGLDRAEIYPSIAKAVLDGPTVLALREPKRIGGTMLIGFTEETDISKDKASSLSKPELGRYVFYWDRRFLRADLYWKQDFEDLVSRRGIDVNDVDKFDFPELAKLAKSAPPFVPPASGAPPFPKSLEIPASKASDASSEPGIREASLPVSAPIPESGHAKPSGNASKSPIAIVLVIVTSLVAVLGAAKLLSGRGKAGQ